MAYSQIVSGRPLRHVRIRRILNPKNSDTVIQSNDESSNDFLMVSFTLSIHQCLIEEFLRIFSHFLIHPSIIHGFLTDTLKTKNSTIYW